MEAIIKETGERIKVWTNYYPTIYKEAVPHGGREFDEDELELIIPPKPIDYPVNADMGKNLCKVENKCNYMTQEDKKLLLKDLCARLPYGLKYNYGGYDGCDYTMNRVDCNAVDCAFPIEDVKPYLFPLSSMTEEMLEELNANGFFKYRDTIVNVSNIESKNGISKEIYTYIDIESISFLTEYFHYHHIDYRGLIPMGLAINATGLNVY